MIELDGERYRLAMPVDEAVSFAMGWSVLKGGETNDAQRAIVGLLAVDELQYHERWRAAALLRACLHELWPDWIE
jgi:hypothetical protein